MRNKFGTNLYIPQIFGQNDAADIPNSDSMIGFGSFLMNSRSIAAFSSFTTGPNVHRLAKPPVPLENV